MLGLDGSAFVQSEWELIREDTVTNATEADIEITVDGNGNAFEITDALVIICIPKQDNQVVIGTYGSILFNENNSTKITAYLGASTIAANSSDKIAFARVINDNGLTMCNYATYANYNNNMSWISHARDAISNNSGAAFLLNSYTFSKIVIKSITGKMNYKLLGKRKRNGLDSPVINVSGTTPTITALPGHRYVCGEVSTLTVTPSSSGDCEVIFESGTTPTVLTLPNTVIMPEWFDATSLEANRTYDILITNGVYGMVMSWAT